MKSLGYDPVSYKHCRLCKDHITLNRDGKIVRVNIPLMIADMRAHHAREWMSKGTCKGCRLLSANYAGERLLYLLRRLGVVHKDDHGIWRWASVCLNMKWNKELEDECT